LALCLLTPVSISARTWYVTPDGSGDAPTIQAGIDSSAVGDTVALGPGTYTETDIELADGVTVRSFTGDPESVVMSPLGISTVFVGTGLSHPDTRIEALTFADFIGTALGCTGTALVLRDCHFEVSSDDAPVVSALESSSLIAEDCSWTGCRAPEVIVARGFLQLTRCVLRDNVPGAGPGHIDVLLNASGSTVEIRDTLIEGNSADLAVLRINGGPSCDIEDSEIRANECHVGSPVELGTVVASVQRCSFVGNLSLSAYSGGGGAIDCWSTDTLVRDCRFESNVGKWGGGIHVTSGGGLRLERSRFVGNHAYAGGALGFVLSGRDDHVVSDCVFLDNSSTTYGGAIYMFWIADYSAAVFQRCTFVANQATFGSAIGALPFDSDGGLIPKVTLDSCLLAFGLPGEAVSVGGANPDVISVGCTDIYGHSGGDWTGLIAPQLGQNGNFSADPLFCDVQAGNFHLQWGSPCLLANSNGCGLVGRYGFGGCNSISVTRESWARIKSRFR
jgi:predicted outer membrane repeat protein